MAFQSKLHPLEIIINDSTLEAITHDPQFGRGLNLGLKGPLGYGSAADPFPPNLEIAESEFEVRIKELEERQNRISDQIEFYKIKCKDQKQTNYCWIFGPTGCQEFVRAQQNQKYISLSPASAGAQIKHYTNQGGWGLEAIQFIEKEGLAPSELWPDTAIDRKYCTPETQARMLDFRVTEWWELRPRNMRQVMGCVLRGIPVAVGYNWWGHEVYACDGVWLDGTLALRIRNSWYTNPTTPWGNNGFGILQGSKMYPDDAVAPRVAIAGA